MAAVGACPFSWAPDSRRGSVVGPLGFVWLPWGHGRSPGPRMVAVRAWKASWAPYGRLEGVAGPLGLAWLQ